VRGERDRERERATLLGLLERVNLKLVRKDGKRSSFRNVVIFSYLEFRTMDRVHEPNNFVGNKESVRNIITVKIECRSNLSKLS
jgi:hypothetical protein